jgi:large subunit ribosomal protein L21
MKPDTWPQQARLAAEGKWDELEALQGTLSGGVAVQEQGDA